MVKIKPDEISSIIAQQLERYDQEVKYSNVGVVMSVGDGIARVYGLEQVVERELLEFADNTIGLALNLEANNVGVVLMGEGRNIQVGTLVRATGNVAQAYNSFDKENPNSGEENWKKFVLMLVLFPMQSKDLITTKDLTNLLNLQDNSSSVKIYDKFLQKNIPIADLNILKNKILDSLKLVKKDKINASDALQMTSSYDELIREINEIMTTISRQKLFGDQMIQEIRILNNSQNNPDGVQQVHRGFTSSSVQQIETFSAQQKDNYENLCNIQKDFVGAKHSFQSFDIRSVQKLLIDLLEGLSIQQQLFNSMIEVSMENYTIYSNSIMKISQNFYQDMRAGDFLKIFRPFRLKSKKFSDKFSIAAKRLNVSGIEKKRINTRPSAAFSEILTSEEGRQNYAQQQQRVPVPLNAIPSHRQVKSLESLGNSQNQVIVENGVEIVHFYQNDQNNVNLTRRNSASCSEMFINNNESLSNFRNNYSCFINVPVPSAQAGAVSKSYLSVKFVLFLVLIGLVIKFFSRLRSAMVTYFKSKTIEK